MSVLIKCFVSYTDASFCCFVFMISISLTSWPYRLHLSISKMQAPKDMTVILAKTGDTIYVNICIKKKKRKHASASLRVAGRLFLFPPGSIRGYTDAPLCWAGGAHVGLVEGFSPSGSSRFSCFASLVSKAAAALWAKLCVITAF